MAFFCVGVCGMPNRIKRTNTRTGLYLYMLVVETFTGDTLKFALYATIGWGEKRTTRLVHFVKFLLFSHHAHAHALTHLLNGDKTQNFSHKYEWHTITSTLPSTSRIHTIAQKADRLYSLLAGRSARCLSTTMNYWMRWVKKRTKFEHIGSLAEKYFNQRNYIAFPFVRSNGLCISLNFSANSRISSAPGCVKRASIGYSKVHHVLSSLLIWYSCSGLCG